VARVRFLLSPRWLLSHLLVILLVVVMINLGFWQLRRLDEKRDRNALIESRMDQPEVPLGDLLDAGDGTAAVDEARYRQVTATGTYDEDTTVEVRNRTQDGSPGAWLVTPMTIDTGEPGDERVGVIRGFVGFRPDGSFEPAEVPSGSVTVTGLAMDPGRLGGTADRDLRPLLSEDGVLPALLMARQSDPAEPAGPHGRDPEGATIEPVPPPELSEGPHLGYAAQWFIFSTIAVVGYPIVLRRVVIRRGKEADDTDDLDSELEELLHKGS
jgi:surfeit locus 1 family protein